MHLFHPFCSCHVFAMTMNHWPSAELFSDVASPGLLLHLDLVQRNLQQLLSQVAGDASRLRPHVKTHKMSPLIRMQLDQGIDQFKVATLSEAAMVASCGARDVLVAYPMLGPNVSILERLMGRYPETTFSCLVDNPVGLHQLQQHFASSDLGPIGIWIDIDCGMHRTGVPFGDQVHKLRAAIGQVPELEYRGLHVYDGHLHQPDWQDRMSEARKIKSLIEADLERYSMSEVVVGGSPTFGFWSHESVWQCSPGTPLLWDQGYGSNYTELDFEIAIALLTRVISKPSADLVCFDLGYKSVASEMPLERRVVLPQVPDAIFVGHSEEHLVVRTALAGQIRLGQEFLAFPRHVCPTVALHQSAQVVQDGQLQQRWSVDARDRLVP
jgi:D-serine deaminase-like pyridoxal phosphate-dependent protein